MHDNGRPAGTGRVRALGAETLCCVLSVQHVCVNLCAYARRCSPTL